MFKIKKYNEKYELLEDDTIGVFNGEKLHRIRALKSFGDVQKGDLGGYIAGEKNLSHSDNAWVFDDARVYGEARVFDKARVYGNARVHGEARVYGEAWVYGEARVYGNARVYGEARVCGEARVFDKALVYGNAWVCGNAEVCDSAWVYDNAKVFGNAEIRKTGDYICVQGLGSANRTTTFYRTKNNGISVVCGCFHGSLDEFVNKVEKKHKDTKYANEYLAAVEVVKIHFEN